MFLLSFCLSLSMNSNAAIDTVLIIFLKLRWSKREKKIHINCSCESSNCTGLGIPSVCKKKINWLLFNVLAAFVCSREHKRGKHCFCFSTFSDGNGMDGHQINSKKAEHCGNVNVLYLWLIMIIPMCEKHNRIYFRHGICTYKVYGMSISKLCDSCHVFFYL